MQSRRHCRQKGVNVTRMQRVEPKRMKIGVEMRSIDDALEGPARVERNERPCFQT